MTLGTNIDTNESRTTTIRADPLILTRNYRKRGDGPAIDETRVMLAGAQVARTSGWPKVTAAGLRRMAEACIAAADAMDGGASE